MTVGPRNPKVVEAVSSWRALTFHRHLPCALPTRRVVPHDLGKLGNLGSRHTNEAIYYKFPFFIFISRDLSKFQSPLTAALRQTRERVKLPYVE